MSRIDDLIAEHCPNGVEFKALGEVAPYSKSKIDSSMVDETNFVGVDNLLPNKAGKTVANYPPNTSRLTMYQPGDILIGNIRPYLKKIWLADNQGGCSGDVLCLHPLKSQQEPLLDKFLYYTLSSDDFFSYNMRHAKGAKMPRGSKADILNYKIPLPPLEIQREIVIILDTFTKLEAELEAELKFRRQQYEHYRNQLLTFDPAGGVRWIPMGEVLEMHAGNHLPASKIYQSKSASHPYPCYGGNGLRGYAESYTHDGETILIGRQGALCGNVHRSSGRIYATEHAIVGTTKIDNLSHAWIYHLLTRMNLNQYKTKSAQPGLSVGRISRLTIPNPNKKAQEAVGEILDKFDALVNDLSFGLPAELAARRKQYEYYRDKLLTFRELGT